MLTRRSFLQGSAVVSLCPCVPSFLAQTMGAESGTRDQPILVVVQLDGGNDGLNTVVPYADENYARYRRESVVMTWTCWSNGFTAGKSFLWWLI